MISINYLIIYLIILNFFPILFIILTRIKLKTKNIQIHFNILMILNMIWGSSIVLYRCVEINKSIRIGFAHINFAFGILFVLYFLVFSIVFCDKKNIFKRKLFITTVINTLILFILSFTDSMVNDIYISGNIVKLGYGYFHKYFILSSLYLGCYSFYILWHGYINSKSEILKFQIRTIFNFSIISFFAGIIPSAIVPAITGQSTYSIISPFVVLIFFASIARLLLQGKKLFIVQSFKNLIKEPAFQIQKNIFALREFFALIKLLILENPEKITRKLNFAGPAFDPISIIIKTTNENDQLERIGLKNGLPVKWFRGLLDNMFTLERDNKRLAFSLIRAQEIIHDSWLKKEVKNLPKTDIIIPLNDIYVFTDYLETLNKNAEEFKESFDVDLLCFSNEHYKLISKMINYSKTNPKSVRGVVAST